MIIDQQTPLSCDLAVGPPDPAWGAARSRGSRRMRLCPVCPAGRCSCS